MGLLDYIPGLTSATPAEAARKEGTLVYYEAEHRWVDLTEEEDPR